MALPSSALPLDWLQGSFDLNVTGSARLSEHPYRIDLSCDARLHDLRAEVPERHDVCESWPVLYLWKCGCLGISPLFLALI